MSNEISIATPFSVATKKHSNVDTLLTVVAVGGAGFILYKYWYLPSKVQQNAAKYSSIIPNFNDYAVPKAIPVETKSSNKGLLGILGSVAGGLVGGVAGFFTGGPAGAAAGAVTGVGVGKKILTSI